jgi:hypothetical protein
MSARSVENARNMAASGHVYMNIQEHTWTAFGCRPNSTCRQQTRHQALATPLIHCQTAHISAGSPLMKRLDQDHLHPKLEGPGLTCPHPELNPGLRGGSELSRKGHSNSLLIAIRNIYIWARKQWRMLTTWLPPVHVLHEHTWTHMNCTRM